MSNDFERPPFVDNMISLKGDLRQQQTAGWTPGPPVHSGLGCEIHADQMIPVAEGISLGADIGPATINSGPVKASLPFTADIMSSQPAIPKPW